MTGDGRRILHLSADYPDPLMPRKTRAVANLLELVPEHTHYVYSLNRVGWRAGIHALNFTDPCGDEHRAIAYGAPPKGIFLKRYLDRLAEWIVEDLDQHGIRPDLVHAHKLSVEGLVGKSVARRIGVPLAVSIQGNSDLKIIGTRPDLVRAWRPIWQEASVVFPFAPWAAERLGRLLGTRNGTMLFLPCPTPADHVLLPQNVGPTFRSAFNLTDYRLKNADGLIKAVMIAGRRVPEIRLEIIGGGDPVAFSELESLAARVAPRRVRFLGAVPNASVQDLFNASCAFVLPSHRESFGMVFAEALLAGCPCLIPRGWGIDGYLVSGTALLAVDADDTREIADGLVRLAREEATFKKRLLHLAETGALNQFRRVAISEVYRSGLAEAFSGTGSADAASPGSGNMLPEPAERK